MSAAGPAWRLFPRNSEREAARRLVDAVSRVSRQPGFFGAARAPDTLEGRLELLYLHAVLAMIRLAAEPSARPLSQHFADRLFRSVDEGLREAGIGDLSVPKKMRKLAGAYYGRLEVYRAAIEARDAPALAAAFGRNIFNAESAPFAAPLATYALATSARLADAPVAALERLDSWGAAPA